jgi:hypothetical protein
MVIEILKTLRSEDQPCRKHDVVVELEMLNSVYRRRSLCESS